MDNQAEAHLALVAVADAIAALANVARPSDGTGTCALFTTVADGKRCPADGAPHTVLRAFGGPPVSTEPNTAAVQAYTIGQGERAAMDRACAIFNALLDDGDPRLDWSVHDVKSGRRWLVDVHELEQPVLIAHDPDNGRAEVSSNFLMDYRRIA